MVAANKVIRQHAKAGGEAQISALVVLGYSAASAAELIKPDSCGRIGYPDYALKNNGAEIRRLKARAAVVQVAQETPATEVQGANARIEDAPADNRVRLFFPGKPDDKVRGKLKANGFRWTPSLGCWQAYRNLRALDMAREIGGAA